MGWFGWFEAVRGHSRSWAMPPFDRSLPQTPLGELTALPDSIAVFKGTY